MSHLVTCQQPADLFRDRLEIVDFLKLNSTCPNWCGLEVSVCSSGTMRWVI